MGRDLVANMVGHFMIDSIGVVSDKERKLLTFYPGFSISRAADLSDMRVLAAD